MSTNVPEPPVTGHRAIDEALAQLNLDGPVAEHAGGFQQVHGVLQQVLNPSPDQPSPDQPSHSRASQAQPSQAQPAGDRRVPAEANRLPSGTSRPTPGPSSDHQRR